jgi:hypothetical protein
MHYVTRRSDRMKKLKFGVTCPGALFMKTALGPPDHENSAMMFRGPDAPKCST